MTLTTVVARLLAPLEGIVGRFFSARGHAVGRRAAVAGLARRRRAGARGAFGSRSASMARCAVASRARAVPSACAHATPQLCAAASATAASCCCRGAPARRRPVRPACRANRIPPEFDEAPRARLLLPAGTRSPKPIARCAPSRPSSTPSPQCDLVAPHSAELGLITATRFNMGIAPPEASRRSARGRGGDRGAARRWSRRCPGAHRVHPADRGRAGRPRERRDRSRSASSATHRPSSSAPRTISRKAR